MKQIFINTLFIIALATAISACTPKSPQSIKTQSKSNGHYKNEIIDGTDYHSFANTQDVIIKHITLNLDVNFDTKTIHGNNWIFFKRKNPNSTQIILDTKDLEILNVNARIKGQLKPLDWQLGQKDELLGQALIIQLPENDESAIIIEYKTSPHSTGLQWLSAEQTTNKKHPFLYTQSQAIHARSWIPLQDTPQVRQTYSAHVTLDKKLRVVMSADNNPKATTKFSNFKFSMPQPIPSYLIAMAAGDLVYKQISPRSGVWADPSIVTKATWEFEDTEKMIQQSEKLYGRYYWEKYDLLILPPSFPYGGMENPRLSFITPTVIASDKSLTSLIAHELAHSWSGNLVTNASWNDLWLNEGFTSYFESRIVEATYGIRIKNMNDVLDYQSLLTEMQKLPKKYQTLTVDLRGKDPDEAFTDVPYIKGKLMLVWLENTFGRNIFDRFLNQYFTDFAFKSISTNVFLKYIELFLIDQYPNLATMEQVHQWIYEPGLPEFAIIPTTDVFSKIDTLTKNWLDFDLSLNDLPTQSWNTQQWLYFLNNLSGQISKIHMQELDNDFSLTNSKNAEIAHIWYLLSIQNDYKTAFGSMQKYLMDIGRLKLIGPLYEELSKTKRGKKWAKSVYLKAKSGYHSQAITALEKILNR